MGVKYFCDRCDNEFKSNGLAIPIYARNASGVALFDAGYKFLCDECAKKFNIIKDRLEYEEDIFDMSDEDISLMETKYNFQIGDEVITSTGQVGIVESICDCDKCKARGFYEPKVKLTSGVDDIYITDNDKNNGFKYFYKIGKYKFGNVDKESIGSDIEREIQNIEASNNRLKEYNKQLERISLLSFSDLAEEL